MEEHYWNHDVFAYIKDFDDPFLTLQERYNGMIEAVKEYNDFHGTRHEPSLIVSRHLNIKRSTRPWLNS